MDMNKQFAKILLPLVLLWSVTFAAAEVTLSPSQPSRGNGTASAPYQISLPEHLAWMAQEVNQGNRLRDLYFVQVADIDLSLSKELNNGEGWMPIGGYFMIGGVRTKTGFEGHYDGGGHTVLHLYINRPEEEYQALFGYISQGSVRNLTITDARVAGLENVAAAFAYTFEAEVENCHVKTSNIDCKAFYGGGLIGFQAWGRTERSSADATLYGRDYIGGLIGWCESGEVKGCHSRGELLGMIYNGKQPRHCGGLIGYCNKSKVERSSCNAQLLEGGEWTGGLVGSAEQSVISESVSRCKKISGLSYVGGIAGRTNESTIRNCYTTASVVGEQYVGGVSGFCTYSTSLIDCVYSIAHVSGSSASSVFVGAVLGGYGTGTVKNILYDASINPTLPAIAGPNQGECEVKSATPEEMRQETFYPNWDFQTIWLLSSSHNNGLPLLRWETDPLWNSLPEVVVDPSSLMLSCRGAEVCIATSAGVELVSVYDVDGTAIPFVRVSGGEYRLPYGTSSSVWIIVCRNSGKLQIAKRIIQRAL